jgi:hypothetical protein
VVDEMEFEIEFARDGNTPGLDKRAGEKPR